LASRILWGFKFEEAVLKYSWMFETGEIEVSTIVRNLSSG
jgi:hypothetical protein